MIRNEYREEDLAVRDYKITVLGIPIYAAKFTSTNNLAVKQLTLLSKLHVHVKGFTN